MRFLVGDNRPHPWAARFGWDRGVTHRVFNGKQLPSPEALIQLATAERVNLTWLLTGDGAPYAVLPIPDPATLLFGHDVHYHLFTGPCGIHQPLVRVGPDADTPLPVQVYSGDPGDLIRVLERLVWKQQPIYLATASDAIMRDLRQGQASNRVLIDEERGLLKASLPELDVARRLASARIEERPTAYLTRLTSSSETIRDEEREWLMLLRELPENMRAALLGIARHLVK